MNDKEAIKIIEELLKSDLPICEYMLKHQEVEAMQKVLNLIEKQKAEIEKKDNITDEMAEYIDEITEKIAREKGVEDFEFCDNKCNDKDEYIECKQCIKEYFENKVKESK